MQPTIEQIRADFPILEQSVNGHPLVYLDSAATAQKPLIVIQTIEHLHRNQNGNIHRGIHYMAEQTTTQYEAARESIARHIGAASPREVIFTSGATASINLVARSFCERFLGEGDNLIISEMEHHSNIVPWQMAAQRHKAEIRVIPFDDSRALDIERLEQIIDDRTRIVAVTQTSNVLGTNNDIERICSIAHQHSVPVMVDGCQGIVHSRSKVVEMGCDFYAFSGHKLYGPTGIGVLYGREELLEQIPPFFGGGDMIANVTLPMGTTYAELPLKFEAGTSNYIGAIGLGAAIEYIESLPDGWAFEHEHNLLKYATKQLTEQVEGLHIYGTTPDKAPIVSFTIDGAHPLDVGSIIDKLGVAIRTGYHCTEPIMHHYGVNSMCRMSFAIYNTTNEIDTAVNALLRARKMLVR